MHPAYGLSSWFRTAVGFDRVTPMLNNSVQYADRDLSYLPYNIEQSGEDDYRVTMAVQDSGQRCRCRRARKHLDRDWTGKKTN